LNTTRKVRVGSRASPLALVQTAEVLALLRPRFPDVEFDVVHVSTQGDRKKDAPLSTLERGTFVKDIEQSLLKGAIDFAIHSAKDLSTDLPIGLKVLPVGERQDARDVLVTKSGLPLSQLPPGTRLGTSSPRRTVQIKAIRPDVELLQIRGNIGTRLGKARGPYYDGIVIAAAGLARLDKLSVATEFLAVKQVTPDIGQGTLVAEFREDDDTINAMLVKIVFEPTSQAFRAERVFLDTLGGGCTAPVAAYATINGKKLNILAMASARDGRQIVRAEIEGDSKNPEGAGRSAAHRLQESGASEFIQS
jgi:hydroxymethylbilane synthase